jgi:hydrogenase maturation protease
MLAERTLPHGVEVVDGGTQGLGIVNLLEGRRRVIIVDTAEMGKAPGQFDRFTPHEARLLGEDQHLSVHAAGLRDALRLAQALEVLPKEIIIFGVQPANLEWDSTLSPEVEETLPNLLNAVLAEVTASNHQTTRGSEQYKGEDKHGKNLDDR